MANSILRDISYSNNSKNYTTLILDIFDKYQIPLTPQNYRIPIYLASASRLYKAIREDTKGSAGRVPALSLEFIGYEPALDRATNRLNKRSIIQLPDGENVRIWRTGVAVDFKFRLNLIAKNMFDLTNISENIMSEFHNTIRYLYYKNMFDESVSVPLVLNSINNESDSMIEDFNSLGLNSMSFDLTVRGHVDMNTPYDTRKITQITLMLKQQHEESVSLLDTYTVIPE